MTRPRAVLAVTFALAGVLLAGCAGGTLPAPSVAGPIATPAPTEDSRTAAPTTEPVDVYAGDVIFGSSVTDDLTIKVPKSTFDRREKKIAWVAHLSEPAGAPRLTWMVLRRKGGTEQLMWSERIDVSPDWTLASSSSALPRFLDHKAGTYIMRYARGDTVLAEGTFKLQ